MQVHYDEGVATRIGPEPCVVGREAGGEASAGITVITVTLAYFQLLVFGSGVSGRRYYVDICIFPVPDYRQALRRRGARCTANQ